MMAHDFDDRLRWSSPNSPSKGPKRVCRFCLLGILMPVLCLVVPLYMRFQALRPHFFYLSPMDMKLLNQESRVSTVWCEAQDLKMNATFNAYLLPQKPRLSRLRHHVAMRRKMMLEDDIKEYWGFHLLRGSAVKLSVCSRHEGASFIIVKGLKDARRCAFLGELDSNEEEESESQEISDEFEFSHEFVSHQHHHYDEDEKAFLNSSQPKSESSELLRALRGLSKQELMERYLRILRRNETSFIKGATKVEQGENNFRAFRIKQKSDDEGETFTQHQDVDLFDGGGGGEELDEDDRRYDDHRGTFNQKTKADGSREEVRSSWSSSEEALAACEGLLYNVPLNGATKCTAEAGDRQLRNISTEVTLDVIHTGFYYFIFANENEITDNFLSASFDLHKATFDVTTNSANCTNATSCQLPLNFFSSQNVVLEVNRMTSSEDKDREGSEDLCDHLLGYSSLAECHQQIMAESVCKPRKALYSVLILLVPILILVFAYL